MEEGETRFRVLRAGLNTLDSYALCLMTKFILVM